MKKMIQAVMTLTLICGSSAAMAQSALSQLGGLAEVDAGPLISQIKAFQTGAQNRPLMIPREPKDALAGCMALEAKPLSLVAWTLPQAVGQIQSCLNNAFAAESIKRSYSVTAKAAEFTVRACPQAAPGHVACQAFKDVEGIQITVSGKVLTGDSVLSDLNFSLQKRGGKLLGWYAELDNKAEILH